MNENYSVSAQNKIVRFPVGSFISWAATAIVVFSCMLLAVALARSIPIFANLFQQLKVEVPWLTHLLITTYYWLVPSFFSALAIFVIWKECSDREPRHKFLLTARVFFTALFATGLMIFVLYLPLLTLASKLAIAK